jgi:hypothetical protein
MATLQITVQYWDNDNLLVYSVPVPTLAIAQQIQIKYKQSGLYNIIIVQKYV